MSARLLPLVFLALSAVALAVSLLNRRNVPEPKWVGYPYEPDMFDRMGVLDARVWLGVSIAFALAALIAFVTARRGAA